MIHDQIAVVKRQRGLGILAYATGGEPGKDRDVAGRNRPGEDRRPFVACKNVRQRAIRTACHAPRKISELGLSTVLGVEEEGRR